MVKEITITQIKFEAFDGTLHDTRAAALEHEESNFEALLADLTIEQVRAAIAREPDSEAISEAMEKAGTIIARPVVRRAN